MIARTNAIRATNAADLVIADNRLHLLDTIDGRATISLAADDVLVERKTLTPSAAAAALIRIAEKNTRLPKSECEERLRRWQKTRP